VDGQCNKIMAQNTQPIYTLVPQSTSTQLTAANTRSDGNGTIGTDIFKVFEAGADGGFVSTIKFMPWATAAATATTATVIRVFISSMTSGATTSADTFLFMEVAAASQSADSSTAAVFPIEVMVNKAIKGGFTVLVSMHAAPAANTGWAAICFGGSYS
jgi:hypothetical protein